MGTQISTTTSQPTSTVPPSSDGKDGKETVSVDTPVVTRTAAVEVDDVEKDGKEGAGGDATPTCFYGLRLPNCKTLAPITFRQACLSPDVIAHMLEADAFTVPAERLSEFGFQRCVDIPAVPEHVYYEGYWHAAGTERGPVTSLNPRTGVNFPKRASPKPVAAFLEAFRRANATWCNVLRDALTAATAGQTARTFGELVGKSWHFADLAVQVHYGDGISPVDIAWHRDAPNSFLHMAVSLHGTRALHSLQHKSSQINASTTQAVDWQKQGDVYVSSPWAVTHGVQYPECTWEDRIIAMQCRFLLTEELLDRLYDSPEDWNASLEVLTPILATATLTMPTLEDVLAVEAEMPE